MSYGLKDIELAKLNEVFAANERIERVILYGSRAKGNYKPFSDVDITLEGAELTHNDLSRLSLVIDDLLLPYQFDISIFHTLKNEALIDHIRRMGITIYEKKSEWKEYKLGEITTEIGDGIHGTPNYSKTGDYYFINGNNIVNGKVVVKSDTKKVDSEQFQKYRKPLSDRTILLSINGTIGSVGYYNNEKCILGKSACYLNIKDTVDKHFVYYVFLTDDFQNHLQNIATGTTIQNVPLKGLRESIISLPPLDEQRRISATLSSLDDKIDLLNRENATLEAMAETLFRQWFIEDAKEDWEEGKLGDWVVIKRGGSPRPINDYLSPTGYRWLKISDVTNLNSPYIFQTKEYIKESGLSKTVYLKKGSLVLSNSATPGIPKILCVDSCIHDGWLYFPKSTFSKIYLYLLFKYIRKDLVNLGNGSIFTNLKTDILKEYKVVKPDAKTMEVFDQQVQPIFDKLYSNETQIQTLIQTRDGLLPRLMSGEVKM